MSIFSNISSNLEPSIFRFFGEQATIQKPKCPAINVTVIKESNNQSFEDDGSLLTGIRVAFYFLVSEINDPGNGCKLTFCCNEYITEGEIYRDEGVVAVAARELKS